MLEGKSQIWPWGVAKPIPWYRVLANVCSLFWLHPRELWTCSVDLQHVQAGWAGGTIPGQHKTRWYCGWNTALGCGSALGCCFGSAPAVVPACPLCQLLLCHLSWHKAMAFWGWASWKGRRRGCGGDVVLFEISLVSHATVLTSLKCAPPQPCRWFPALVTDLCSELSCTSRKCLSNLGMDNSTPEYQLYISAPFCLVPCPFFQKFSVFQVFA